MERIKKTGKWIFEVKQIFARKTQAFGDEFTASAVITITDGEPHIELLINKHDDKLTKQDFIAFKNFLINLGFKNAKFSRFKNGIKKEAVKVA